MLYLHCGWPRTGTTSLQAALFDRRDELAHAQIMYPDRWKSRNGLTHHGLFELLSSPHDHECGRDAFRDFLVENDDKHILFSAEALTFALLSSTADALSRCLAAAQEIMPTRCIWTLRRFDELIHSIYLLRLSRGNQPLSPTEFLNGVGEPVSLFRRMKELENVVNGNVVYVKYESSGAHNSELLKAFDVPGPLASTIQKELEHPCRLNVSLSHKKAHAILNAPVLSTRVGMELSDDVLRSVFRSGFVFEQDQSCELVDVDVSRALHERGLSAARRSGFSPFTEFYEQAEPDVNSMVAVGSEALTDEDLERLIVHLSMARPG